MFSAPAKDSGSQLTDYTDSTCPHTHTNTQVMHPAAVALIPCVSSSAALSHPSTLSFTSRQHTPGVEGTHTASKDLCNTVEMVLLQYDRSLGPTTTNGCLNCAQASFTVICLTAWKNCNVHYSNVKQPNTWQTRELAESRMVPQCLQQKTGCTK